MNSRLLGRIRCHESDRGSDQCSIPNAQFSSEVDVGLPNVPPMQDKIARSDQFEERLFSFRMRIGNWELNTGQILPSPHNSRNSSAHSSLSSPSENSVRRGQISS